MLLFYTWQGSGTVIDWNTTNVNEGSFNEAQDIKIINTNDPAEYKFGDHTALQ